MDLRQRPPKPPVNNSDGSYRFHKDLTSSTPDDHRCRTTIAPPPKASDALPLPLYLTNAVFFSVAYYLLHRWRDKIRYNTPLHVVTITELGAIIALIASFIYLLGFFGIDFVQSFISRASGDAWDLADSTDADRNFIIDNDDHRLVTCSPPPPPITKLPNLEPIATESLPEEDEEVVKSVLDGVIPSYSLESRLGDCKREASIRREALQRVTGRSMEGLPLDGFDYESILRQCCEMLAGYVQIPVGIAGPFLLDGYEYSVPMATTEGCLVASTNRGCKAMYISGGATSTVLKDGMTRAPVVRFGEKWFRHYSSEHQILLVGERDFSFSRCLALAFGSATNITATSLDSEEELCEKFKNAMDNVSLLKRYGCDIQHEVDVHMMSFDNSLSLRRYDRIVFNFPHAGSRFFGREFSSRAIEGHQELVRGFLENAKEMLKEDGEIHITHKTTYPFSNWKIKTLAKGEGLKLFKKSKFKLSHYPGYMNKRGSGGRRSDQDFPVGQCSTLMFIQS